MEATTNVDIIFVDAQRDPTSLLQSLIRNVDKSLVAISLHKEPNISELSRAVAVISHSKTIRLVVTSREDDTIVLTKDALEAVAKTPLGCVGRESLRELLKRATARRTFGVLKISGGVGVAA